MSAKKFYTPRFIKMANVSLSNRLNPVLTGKLGLDGQIDAEQTHRDLVLDKERERSHYFDGKLLKAQDLLRDQNYLDARLRQAGRAFGAGIIAGLEAALDDGWISVAPGSGITPSGLVIELREHTLRAPVNDAALRQALNRGRHGYLNSGLYLVLLSWHEETSDAIAEVYPRKASVQPQAQPDAYQQGVKLELMPLQKGVPVNDELLARAQLADEFLRFGAEFPGMPSDSLPVALLAVRNNRPVWLDATLVKRDYRDEREAHAQRLRHRHQYSDLLEDLVRRRHAGQSFELNRYFKKVPAMGPLPKSFVDPSNQSFTGFPDHYQLELVPVRAEDIAFLMSQTAHLPPIQLRSRKSENIQVLVPLQEGDFETLVAALESASPATTARATFSTVDLSRGFSEISLARDVTRTLPFDRLLSSRIRPHLFTIQPQPAKTAWETAFDTISNPVGLFYMREFQLAAIQAPQVLPISAGFPQPVQPELPVEPTPVEPTPVEPTPVEPPVVIPAEPPVQPLEPTIFDIIKARGSIHQDTKVAVEKLRPILEDDIGAKTLITVFEHLDNTYDRLFWRAMVQTADAKNMLATFHKQIPNMAPFDIIQEFNGDFQLDDLEVRRWIQVAKAVGDLL